MAARVLRCGHRGRSRIQHDVHVRLLPESQFMTKGLRYGCAGAQAAHDGRPLRCGARHAPSLPPVASSAGLAPARLRVHDTEQPDGLLLDDATEPEGRSQTHAHASRTRAYASRRPQPPVPLAGGAHPRVGSWGGRCWAGGCGVLRLELTPWRLGGVADGRFRNTYAPVTQRKQRGDATKACASARGKRLPTTSKTLTAVHGKSEARVRAAPHGQTPRGSMRRTPPAARARPQRPDVLEFLSVIVVAPVLVHDVLLRLGEACLE